MNHLLRHAAEGRVVVFNSFCMIYTTLYYKTGRGAARPHIFVLLLSGWGLLEISCQQTRQDFFPLSECQHAHVFLTGSRNFGGQEQRDATDMG